MDPVITKIPLPAIALALTLAVTAPAQGDWSDPITLVSAHGRIAVGNRVHVVGHLGGNLVHRSSQDGGPQWSSPAVIAPASGNFPMQYGGLYAVGDSVYLLTAAGDMGPLSRHLDFRKSIDNGDTWSSPVRITGPGQEIRRANIVASGDSVHVLGGQSGAGGFGTGIYYFRSIDGGVNWEPGVLLRANADGSAKMAVDGSTLHVAYGEKLAPSTFQARAHYMRSADNGSTWSAPVLIGEQSTESNVQSRLQIAAADGRVLAFWTRGHTDGIPPQGLPNNLGGNRSNDSGLNWIGPEQIPGTPGVHENHQQGIMLPGGAVHLAWAHGLGSGPAGYLFSSDYGATWSDVEIAISTAAWNLPHNIAADDAWVHIIAEPGAGTYARRSVATFCYPNCDRSTVEPILNVDDFTCFINEFSAAQSLPHEEQVGHYANCDGSTTAPALNVDDFTCFIDAFAAGCL